MGGKDKDKQKEPVAAGTSAGTSVPSGRHTSSGNRIGDGGTGLTPA
jgi:hypothetical protein